MEKVSICSIAKADLSSSRAVSYTVYCNLGPAMGESSHSCTRQSYVYGVQEEGRRKEDRK